MTLASTQAACIGSRRSTLAKAIATVVVIVAANLSPIGIVHADEPQIPLSAFPVDDRGRIILLQEDFSGDFGRFDIGLLPPDFVVCMTMPGFPCPRDPAPGNVTIQNGRARLTSTTPVIAEQPALLNTPQLCVRDLRDIRVRFDARVELGGDRLFDPAVLSFVLPGEGFYDALVETISSDLGQVEVAVPVNLDVDFSLNRRLPREPQDRIELRFSTRTRPELNQFYEIDNVLVTAAPVSTQPGNSAAVRACTDLE